MEEFGLIVARCDRLLEIGRAEEAMTLLLGDSRTPADTGALVTLARCYHRLDRDKEALKTAEAALALDPENIDGWMTLAMCELALGLPAQALPSARRAVELAPWFPGAHSITAQILGDLGRFPQAQLHVDKIMELDPDGTRGLLAQSRLQLAQQQWDSAARSATEALGRDPENDEARILLSMAQVNSSSPTGRAEAMETLAETLRNSPDQDAVRRFLIEVALNNKPNPKLWLPIIFISFFLPGLGWLLFLGAATWTIYQLWSSIPKDVLALIWADRPWRYRIIGVCAVVAVLWLLLLNGIVSAAGS